jgi:hypothetical protein
LTVPACATLPDAIFGIVLPELSPGARPCSG